MSNTVKGTVIEVGGVQTFSNGSFKKRELTVRIDEDSPYPQEVPIEFVQAKTDLIENLRAGDKVAVDINIRGSKYNGRRFSSINGWRVSVLSPGNNDGSPEQDQPTQNETSNSTPNQEADDDLPF